MPQGYFAITFTAKISLTICGFSVIWSRYWGNMPSLRRTCCPDWPRVHTRIGRRRMRKVASSMVTAQPSRSSVSTRGTTSISLRVTVSGAEA